ncbi:prion-like-(Q/N-rich) domain-bearing protein 25 [Ruditapes philippinarum]|uniref:prion-like-(Q/N-rich) domain-bearing protein 25 n=1 Tax=Ruditapes philippinarum TaxID=129788 RepID=UPI00295AB0AB|nr:prion-like-(Q/N-rich) domain-bearing protein 25 [Ruditapes philippinarum]
MMKGSMLFIYLCCMFKSCQAAGYGKNCTDTDDCTGFTECIDDKCTCSTGYVVNTDDNGCKARLGYNCTGNVPCNDQSSVCDSTTTKCVCKSNYYDSNGADVGGTCVEKVGLGSNCSMPNACSSSRAECVGSRCRCTNTYYDTNTDNTIGGSCETRINLGASCSGSHSNNKQCIDQNASCQCLPSYICSCDERYHRDGSNCKPNVALGGNCKGGVLNECSDPHAECINRTCTCSVGFYHLNEANSRSICKTGKVYIHYLLAVKAIVVATTSLFI